MWHVDGQKTQGDRKWERPEEEEPDGSIQSVWKKKANIIDLDRICFAADAERSGDSITKELSKKRFCGDGCSKVLRGHWSCKKRLGAA